MLEGESFYRWFGLLPIALAVLYGLFRANYLRFKELYERLARYERSDDIQDAIAQLSRLRTVAIDELYATPIGNADEVVELRRQEKLWTAQVISLLRDRFSEPVWRDFDRLGILQPEVFEHHFDADHNHVLRIIACRIRKLERLIEKYVQP